MLKQDLATQNDFKRGVTCREKTSCVLGWWLEGSVLSIWGRCMVLLC